MSQCDVCGGDIMDCGVDGGYCIRCGKEWPATSCWEYYHSHEEF